MRYLLAICIVAGVQLAAHGQSVSFDRDVLPLLQAKCFRCHNGQRAEGGLRLDRRDSVLKGGDSGRILISGNAADSLLLERIKSSDESLRMPQEAAQLSAAETGTIARWIEQGIRGLRDVKQTEHWAFQPIRTPSLPTIKDSTWPRNAIDVFVLARMEQAGLKPAPRASRVQLLRRLFFDLLGVPPTIREVEDFESDESENAYQQLVDRLLSDPRFGERWGRHWLDLARYADSAGYEADLPRKIWHYRDWVIRAFNQDKPITDFVVEQIGGDLLPEVTRETRIASGFHCNAMLDGGVREQAVLDRVNSTGAVFLGLTLECAQCHDHKTDPVTQKEYYQLYAFFHGASAVEFDLSSPELKSRIAGVDEQLQTCNQRLAEIDAKIKEHLNSLVAAALQDPDGIDAAILTLLKIPAPQRSEADVAQLESYFQSKDSQRKQLAARRDELQKQRPDSDTTLVFAQDNRPTHIFVRGNPRQLGEQVQSGTPSFLPPIQSDHQASEASNRVALGQWLVAHENPLFARVMINRIWMRLLGNAIVESENDFGVQTARPIHWMLLDHLATVLQQEDSFKGVIRSIVNSAVYQQSSHFKFRTSDGDGLFQGQRRFRLEVEALRDNALAVSGLLENEIGGPSVFPPQPSGVLDFRATPATWTESQGADRYRRGMYTYIWRLTPHPLTSIFDGPDLTTSCTRRTRSNVALQSLALLNDPIFVEAAQALAQRVLLVHDSTEDRLAWLFSTALNRNIREDEQQILEQLLTEQRLIFQHDATAASLAVGKFALQQEHTVSLHEQAAWVAVCRTMMNLDEFIMRE